MGNLICTPYLFPYWGPLAAYIALLSSLLPSQTALQGGRYPEIDLGKIIIGKALETGENSDCKILDAECNAYNRNG